MIHPSTNGYLFPNPPKHLQPIYAVVVEKKGDETRTSMRQSEIYAYSNDIIIRDGYMVMPKIYWKDYEPGEWFMSDREFSTDRNGNLKEERELKNFHKIHRSAYESVGIPPTAVVHGNVRVTCLFVVCPSFIRNRKISNSYGTYDKLILMNIGQGFIHGHKRQILQRLQPGYVYNGVFEFRAKDNGAVNFSPRTEIRDSTNHVLERDAMWELMELKDDPPVLISQHEIMKDELGDLHKYAKQNEAVLIEKGYYKRYTNGPLKVGKPLVPPSVTPKPTVNTRADQLSSELAKLCVNKPQESARSRLQNAPLPSTTPNRNTPTSSNVFRPIPSTMSSNSGPPMDTLTFPIIRTREDLENHRKRVIVQRSFTNERGDQVDIKWLDRETNENAMIRDLLDYKFTQRHWPPSLPTESRRDWSIADVSAVERPPLASSTPLTSPQQQRRQVRLPVGTHVRNLREHVNQTENSQNDISHNSTSLNLAALRRDNNANPVSVHQAMPRQVHRHL